MDPTGSRRTEVRFALAGDMMITSAVAGCARAEFRELVEKVREADVAAVNLETLFHDFEGYPAVHSGGIHVRANPALVEEVKWMGFRMVSLANNHAGDYGAASLLAHLHHVAASGLAHAGIGPNLTVARRHGMLESPVGRVALVSCTSTIPAGVRAGPGRDDVKGRPGVNPLRFETVEHLDGEGISAALRLESHLEQKSIAARDEVVIGGQRFRLAARRATTTSANEADLAAFLESIRSARREADWVIAAMHGHRNAPGDRGRPADFMKDCARAALDAGADFVFGHGPHVLRGIEIHRGKPIFYSLGNFIVQFAAMDRFAADAYECYGLGSDASPDDLRACLYRRAAEKGDEREWESVLASPIFVDGHLDRIELLPLLIESDGASPWRGIPMVAKGKEAARVINRLSELSEEFGTEIVMGDGMGRVVP